MNNRIGPLSTLLRPWRIFFVSAVCGPQFSSWSCYWSHPITEFHNSAYIRCGYYIILTRSKLFALVVSLTNPRQVKQSPSLRKWIDRPWVFVCQKYLSPFSVMASNHLLGFGGALCHLQKWTIVRTLTWRHGDHH